MSDYINRVQLAEMLIADQGKNWNFEAKEDSEEPVALKKKEAFIAIDAFFDAICGVALSGEDFVIQNFGKFTTTEVKAGVFVSKDPKTGVRKEIPTPAFGKPRLVLAAAGKRIDSGFSNEDVKKRAFITNEDAAKLAVNSDTGLSNADFTVVVNYLIQSIIDMLANKGVIKLVGKCTLEGKFIKGGKRNIAGRECDVADKVAVKFKASKKYRRMD